MLGLVPFKNRQEVEAYLSQPRLPCLVCGRTFAGNLGRHVLVHDISADDYKRLLGIPISYGLLAPKCKKKKSDGCKANTKVMGGFVKNASRDGRVNGSENSAYWLSEEKGAHLNNVRPDMNGELSPRATLSKKQVLEIQNSDAKAIDLSRQYNVDSSTISKIRKGKRWKSAS